MPLNYKQTQQDQDAELIHVKSYQPQAKKNDKLKQTKKPVFKLKSLKIKPQVILREASPMIGVKIQKSQSPVKII